MTLTSVRRIILPTLAAAVVAFAAQLWADPLPIDPGTGETTPTTSGEEKELQDALEDFKKADFDETLKKLEEAVKKYPRLPPAQVIMATWFFRANRVDLGRAALERAVLDTPDDPEPYLIFGDLALQQRQVTNASVLYEKGQQLLAGFEGDAKRKELMEQHVERGLASVAEARQQWDVAQKHLEKWLELSPGNAAALQRLGRVLFQQDSVDDALARLRAAKQSNENMLTPEAMIALYYEQSGDRKKAEEWMIKALTVEDKNPNTRLAAAQWALNAGRIEEARQQCAYAIKPAPESLAAKQLRGIIALFEKDFLEAERQFEAVVDEQPGSFAATNNLALALIEQDDVKKRRKALDLAADNARQFQQRSEALSTYGWVLYKLGQLDQAIQVLNQCLRLGNPSPDTIYYMAQALADKEQYGQAVQLLEKAMETERPFSMKPEAEKLLAEAKPKVKEPASKESAGE